MLNSEQIQYIEKELNVALLLQTESMIMFMEKDTEKQVILNLEEVVKEALFTKLHPPQISIKNNNAYTWGKTITYSTNST